MSTICSNAESKSLSKWQDCLMNELLWQIILYSISGVHFSSGWPLSSHDQIPWLFHIRSIDPRNSSDIKNALMSLCNTHIYWHIYSKAVFSSAMLVGFGVYFWLCPSIVPHTQFGGHSFFPIKPGNFFSIQSGQELLCEQMRHLTERWFVRQEMPAVFD